MIWIFVLYNECILICVHGNQESGILTFLHYNIDYVSFIKSDANSVKKIQSHKEYIFSFKKIK